MSVHIHQRLLVVAVSATFAVLLFGCHSIESRQSELEREAGRYYKAYLDGDAQQARQSLEQLIQFYQSPQTQILGQSSQAHSLFCTYGRLYVLEKRVGDMDEADVALTKARYWHLQDYELSDDGWKTRVGLHEFLSYQTPDWFEDTMGKLDKGANRGNQPMYVQHLAHAQPNILIGCKP